MHGSIGPWARVLQMLANVPTSTITASMPKRRQTSTTSGRPSKTRPHKRARFSSDPPASIDPKPSTDPFSRLPLNLIANIVRDLNPLDILIHQRVCKSWRVVLASEYIYTLSLRQQFPYSAEAARVWELHLGGEQYPSASVEAYRAAAYRHSRRQLARPVQVKRYNCKNGQSGTLRKAWTIGDGWLVFNEVEARSKKNRLGVQRLGEATAGRRWIKFPYALAMDLALGGGFLRVYLTVDIPQPNKPIRVYKEIRVYDIQTLSLVWTHRLPLGINADLTQNIDKDHTAYIVQSPEQNPPTLGETRQYDLHILSVPTGEDTIIPIMIPGGETPVTSFLTPTTIAVSTADELLFFSTTTGALLESLPLPHFLPTPERFAQRATDRGYRWTNGRSLPPPPGHLKYRYSASANTLHVTNKQKAWTIAIERGRISVQPETTRAVMEPDGYPLLLHDGEGTGMELRTQTDREPYENNCVWSLYLDVLNCAGERRRVLIVDEKAGRDAMRERFDMDRINGGLCDERWVVVGYVSRNEGGWMAIDFGLDEGV